MSLFNICNWWSTQCPDLDENYDVSSLLCARFGLDEQEKDYIVVGSHAGHLSIFYPTLKGTNFSDETTFRPTDLLYEKFLDNPILGVFAGRFSGSGNENANQLAVLHPNSVIIYKIQTTSGVAEHGTQVTLQNLSEYWFERVAFTFCKGHFGQVKGREFFCVVHLDGTLTFFEQDGISYECQFPGHRALPAPVVYCERTDSFMRFGASWNIECFTYQDLSHSSINKDSYHPVWSVCVGEGVIDMCIVQDKESSSSLLILGEHNFICLSDSGQLRFMLKLDYAPKCFHSFLVGYYWESTSRLITAIVSESSRLFLYEGGNIMWAAHFGNETPVAIRRSNINGLPGAIVSLGPRGTLNIGYLGSDPFQFQVPTLEIEDISFADAQKELIKLEEEIKESVDMRDVESLNQRAHDDVKVSFDINSEISEDSDAMLLDVPAEVSVKEFASCMGVLKIKTKINIAEIQIAFNVPEGIRCSQDTLTICNINAGVMQPISFEFYIAELLHLHSTKVEVLISFINTKGIPRVISKFAYLPIKMFYKTRSPQKSAGIKLTFNINSPYVTPKLSTFFPEFVSPENDNAQALGLTLLCPGMIKFDEIITIVVAKNSNRIRVQSDRLETFPMILERIIETTLRVDAIAKAEKGIKDTKTIINKKSLVIVSTPLLPIQEILHRIDVHRETQENIRKQMLEMDELWLQFKNLQRKLQEKSEDDSKETLIMQIEENYDHLILEGDKLTEIRSDEKKQRCDLTCALSVAMWIISTLQIEEKVVNIISSVISLPIEDWTEVSWEESMSPGIDMLHHYGPLNRSKHASNKNSIPDNATAYNIFDYSRFRRHFSTLLERVTKIVIENPKDTTEEQDKEKDSAEHNQNKRNSSLGETEIAKMMEIAQLAAEQQSSNKRRTFNSSSLEPVEDEENEEDAEDLRQVGYMKSYGSRPVKNEETSEWINEQFELPSSEELFSDLGIWW